MYPPQGRESLEHGAEAPLMEQLQHDESGELRDQWVDELRVAAQEIEAALDEGADPAQADILRDLLDAVRSSENVLMQVWESLRG